MFIASVFVASSAIYAMENDDLKIETIANMAKSAQKEPKEIVSELEKVGLNSKNFEKFKNEHIETIKEKLKESGLGLIKANKALNEFAATVNAAFADKKLIVSKPAFEINQGNKMQGPQDFSELEATAMAHAFIYMHLIEDLNHNPKEASVKVTLEKNGFESGLYKSIDWESTLKFMEKEMHKTKEEIQKELDFVKAFYALELLQSGSSLEDIEAKTSTQYWVLQGIVEPNQQVFSKRFNEETLKEFYALSKAE